MDNKNGIEDINKLLISAIKLHNYLIKEKNYDLAKEVIAVTSKFADLMLELSNARKDYKKVYCKCGSQLREGFEIRFFNDVGHCLACENHINEQMEEKPAELGKEGAFI